jgi:hypothetical protein
MSSDLFEELGRTEQSSFPAVFRKFLPDTTLEMKAKVGIDLMNMQIKKTGSILPYVFFLFWDDEIKAVVTEAVPLRLFDVTDLEKRNEGLFKLGAVSIDRTVLGIGLVFGGWGGDKFNVMNLLGGEERPVRADCGISAFSSIDGRTVVGRCSMVWAGEALVGLVDGPGGPFTYGTDQDLFSSFWLGYNSALSPGN